METLRHRYFKALGINSASTDELKLKAALARAYELRSFEIEHYWKRATYFWGLQLVVFGALSLLLGRSVSARPILFAVAGLGVLTSIAQSLSARGSRFWQKNWEHHIDMLEDEVEGRLYKTVWEKNKEASFSVSRLNQWLSDAFSAFWVLALVYSGWISVDNSISASHSLWWDWVVLPIELLGIGFLGWKLTRQKTNLREKKIGVDFMSRHAPGELQCGANITASAPPTQPNKCGKLVTEDTQTKVNHKWLGLFAIFFLLASMLGYWVSGAPLLSRDASSSLQLEVLTSAAGRLNELPSMSFSIPAQNSLWFSSVSGISVTLIFTASSAHPPRFVMSQVESCILQQPQGKGVTTIPSEETRFLPDAAVGQATFAKDFSQIDIPADTTSPAEEAQTFVVICKTSWKPGRDSFSGRTLEVSARSTDEGDFDDTPEGKPKPSPLYDRSGSFLLNFGAVKNQKGFRSFGGNIAAHNELSDGNGRRLDDDGDLVTMLWEDGQAAATKDLILIAAGALYGLAGASLIEWLRGKLK